MRPLLALLVGFALLVAGCTSSPPPQGEHEGPTGLPGQGGSGNSTRGNDTASSGGGPAAPEPPAPQPVHEGSYPWAVTAATAEDRFTVAAGFTRLDVNITQEGPGAGTLNVDVLDPGGTSQGVVSVSATPDGTGSAQAQLRASPGEWALRFGGTGVGTLGVQVVAS